MKPTEVYAPGEVYPRWKLRLKRRIVRTVYAAMLRSAAPNLGRKRRIRVLKTDLWGDALGVDSTAALRGATVYGVDFAPLVCGAAAGASRRVHIAQADIRWLPFADGSFDMVADLSTLDHVRPEEAAGVVSGYSRVLAEGGVLVMCVDSKLSPFWQAYRRTLPYPCWSWRPSALRRLAAGAGLEVLGGRYANTPIDWLFKWFSARVTRTPLAPLLATAAQFYVVTARKPRTRGR